MFTKPLTHQPITAVDVSSDMNSINRLLVAAAISPRFCASLLADPGRALQAGFGGERFPLSQSTLNLLDSIRVSSLTEFAHQLDENLSQSRRIA